MGTSLFELVAYSVCQKSGTEGENSEYLAFHVIRK